MPRSTQNLKPQALEKQEEPAEVEEGGVRAQPSPLKTLAGGATDQPNSPQSGQALDSLVIKALAQGPPPHQVAEPPAKEQRAPPPSP